MFIRKGRVGIFPKCEVKVAVQHFVWSKRYRDKQMTGYVCVREWWRCLRLGVDGWSRSVIVLVASVVAAPLQWPSHDPLRRPLTLRSWPVSLSGTHPQSSLNREWARCLLRRALRRSQEAHAYEMSPIFVNSPITSDQRLVPLTRAPRVPLLFAAKSLQC